MDYTDVYQLFTSPNFFYKNIWIFEIILQTLQK